jgi:FdhD protein
MSEPKTTRACRALLCSEGVCREGSLELIGEEPLLIRIEDKPYSVVMRTPGEEKYHAAGFCLGEGIADDPGDFLIIGYCKDMNPNVVEVRLRPDRCAQIGEILQRRGFLSQTSCGICGKEMVEDIRQRLAPPEKSLEVPLRRIAGCIDRLVEMQQHYRTTRGSHAALVLDGELEPVAFAEDVGRHNALDKAVGKAFMQKKLSEARVLVLSSRVSYELVQKAARAQLPMIVSASRPTALAVEMGTALGLTIAIAADSSDVSVVCGEQRVRRD